MVTLKLPQGHFNLGVSCESPRLHVTPSLHWIRLLELTRLRPHCRELPGVGGGGLRWAPCSQPALPHPGPGAFPVDSDTPDT